MGFDGIFLGDLGYLKYGKWMNMTYATFDDLPGFSFAKTRFSVAKNHQRIAWKKHDFYIFSTCLNGDSLGDIAPLSDQPNFPDFLFPFTK